MPQCKRCQAPIRWQKGDAGGPRWIALDPADGAQHSCPGPKTCRYCEKPIVWKDHEGKRQCFELDGTTPHLDVCANRDKCGHCGQKVRWTLVDGRWLALDAVLIRELHWSFCPKNPDGAKALIARLARLEEENAQLRNLTPEKKHQTESAAFQAEIARLQREIAYKDVELRRLTARAEGRTGKRA